MKFTETVAPLGWPNDTVNANVDVPVLGLGMVTSLTETQGWLSASAAVGAPTPTSAATRGVAAMTAMAIFRIDIPARRATCLPDTCEPIPLLTHTGRAV